MPAIKLCYHLKGRNLALLKVAASMKPGFTLQRLAVAAWQADPKHWSIRGEIMSYPDTLSVAQALRAHGLIEKGFVTSCDGKLSLTPRGIDESHRVIRREREA